MDQPAFSRASSIDAEPTQAEVKKRIFKLQKAQPSLAARAIVKITDGVIHPPGLG